MTATLLSRERSIAPPGWSRWLVPPAALAIHLSIGQAYAWSVLKTPVQTSLHTSAVGSALPFQVAILVLGLSAAFGGTTVERRGPRWSMIMAAIFWGAGFLVAALGIVAGQLWLVVVGYGVIGGIGLGLGYIAPVSTLIKWFPDRPGLATGLAIMGFGGGALVATPLSTALLSAFGKTGGGLALVFVALGVIYLVWMLLGAALVRLPRASEGVAAETPVPQGGVPAASALKTPQFWLLWVVLCFNVTAGIGVLERAAPLYQDFFAGMSTPTVLAAAGTAFVALLSLANMLGRFLWSTASDAVGRKNMYRIYLGVGALLYLLLLLIGPGNKAVFLIATLLILSFYGAGFATLPAYLKDLFGVYQVGAIHGRLLTAWSVAGVLGPLIVDGVVDANSGSGGSPASHYTTAFVIMIVLLLIGFVCNELIRPVPERLFIDGTGAAAEVEEGVAR
ncbi:OFA family MFS transporter [Actinomycetospora endophytica]|uniref:OFA family MFS transporter n=1 Tax=Actinomycetospora endophytica TaxID=2291215 RepID=A0ABS8PDR4_9PSEU|nr:OFA family MFS transporter [Actinomycetospora endophytica]MCD2196383.1 OFA family MFS transporter [Actinomycetospora endophytica]